MFIKHGNKCKISTTFVVWLQLDKTYMEGKRKSGHNKK